MRCRLSALAIAVLSLAADAPDDAVAREKAKLAGTWTVTALEVNGQKVPPEAVRDVTFTFTADTLTRAKGDKKESGAGYKLDPAKTPKWIDMTGVTDGKERAVPGLYELDGDTLKLCFRADYKAGGKINENQKRPAKLDGGAGSERVLMVLRREKR
jgi:uncharacterized protein (TIGR03067 family)